MPSTTTVNLNIERCFKVMAGNVRVTCPSCGTTVEGFIGDPRGGEYDCEECGRRFQVHPDAEIDLSY